MRKNRFKSRKKILKNINNFMLIAVIIIIFCYFSFNYIYIFIFKKININEVFDMKYNNFDINKFLIGIEYKNDIIDAKNTEIKGNEYVSKRINKDPIIYIYNTHQTEEYKANSYNYRFTVFRASLILQNKLNKLGIETIVEKNNIKEILDLNNWNYRNSYKASKMLATDALSKNNSIKYVIDLHRDSIPEDKSYCNFNNKKYAKIMLVLGKGHENYNKNLEIAEKINSYSNEIVSCISRGLDIKENSGIYNQDICPNAVLIEVGSEYNDLESVANSLDVLAHVYERIINEES